MLFCASEAADSNGYHLILFVFFFRCWEFFFAILFLMWCHLTMSLYVASNKVSLARLINSNLMVQTMQLLLPWNGPHTKKPDFFSSFSGCEHAIAVPLKSAPCPKRSCFVSCCSGGCFFLCNNSYNHTYVLIFLRSVFVNDHISFAFGLIWLFFPFNLFCI